MTIWLDTFLEANSPDLLSFPMERTLSGAAFKTGQDFYTGIISGTPRNWNDGLRWFPIDTDLKPDHSAGLGFPHTPFMGVKPGGVVFQNEISFKLKSVGQIDRAGYRPIWYPGPVQIKGPKLIQQVGPFELVYEFWEQGMREIFTIHEMPPISTGALAFEYDCAGLSPPDT